MIAEECAKYWYERQHEKEMRKKTNRPPNQKCVVKVQVPIPVKYISQYHIQYFQNDGIDKNFFVFFSSIAKRTPQRTITTTQTG